MNFQYSEISVTGQLPKRPDNMSDQDYKAWICSKALSDWGVCMMGKQLPTTFGEGMVKVGELLGIHAIPDLLMKYSDKFLNKGTISEL